MITKFLKTLIRGLPNHTEEDFAQICEETSKNQKILLKEINEEEKLGCMYHFYKVNDLIKSSADEFIKNAW